MIRFLYEHICVCVCIYMYICMHTFYVCIYGYSHCILTFLVFVVFLLR